MDIEKLMSLLYIGAAAICGIAALATAIIFTAKKKATKSLISYGLLVALLLGGGFIASNNNPVPNSRYNPPEPISQPRPSKDYIPDYIQRLQPSDPPQPEPVPEPETPAKEDMEPVVEAEPEQVPDEPESGVDPAPVKRKPSTAKISTPSAASAPEQIPSREPSTAQPVYPVNAAPVRTPQPSFGLDENPSLAPDPTIETISNPAVLYDPAWLAVQGDRDNGFVPPRDDTTGSINDSSGPSGGGSSATYTHDFSNGRVLATSGSNNNNDPVYHTHDCRSAVTIPKENEIWYASEQAAKDAGRRLCENCSG